jgi:hypothetical protein
MSSHTNQALSLLYLLIAALLFLAILKMPAAYYDFLRVVVTVGAIVAIVVELKEGFSSWVLAFAILAVLFNPIEPIYLYKKSVWAPLDFLGGLTFLLRGLAKK